LKRPPTPEAVLELTFSFSVNLEMVPKLKGVGIPSRKE
jgi:hypothetical protein